MVTALFCNLQTFLRSGVQRAQIEIKYSNSRNKYAHVHLYV